MKKLAFGLLAAVPVALLAWVYYRAFCLSPDTDPATILNYRFTGAAYAITWAIQLGYLAWLAIKERAQNRNAARSRAIPR
ncbi:MAG: hypothetical protein ABR924_01610 [Terracidiphilus sp.]|jgi:hypothetical protein